MIVKGRGRCDPLPTGGGCWRRVEDQNGSGQPGSSLAAGITHPSEMELNMCDGARYLSREKALQMALLFIGALAAFLIMMLIMIGSQHAWERDRTFAGLNSSACTAVPRNLSTTWFGGHSEIAMPCRFSPMTTFGLSIVPVGHNAEQLGT